MKLPLLSLPILVAPVFLCLPAAGMQAFRVEQSIDCEPIDVATTPDGALAVVRSVDTGTSTQMVTVWDLLTGASYPVTPCASGTLGRGSPTQWRSDAVAVTNSRAVLIGSYDDPAYYTGAVEDTTRVDILSLDYTTDPVVTCLNTFDLQGSPTANSISGGAHDVAITPDGRLAVVHAQNWIYVFSLRNATLAGQINIGLDNEPTPLWTSPKSSLPNDAFVSAVDSVECTNTRAVVVTNVYIIGGTGTTVHPRAWVYIVDLTSNPPVLVNKHKVLSNVGLPSSFSAHDLAITPDASKAVVACSGAVSFFNLATGLPIGPTEVNQSAHWRQYPLIADSVECTNTRAVTISNTIDFPGINSKYRIDVFDLTAGDPGSAALRTYNHVDTSENRAHDLAITPDGLQAIVKAEQDSILITSLAAPPATPVLFGSAAQPLGANTFVSDSIVATNSIAVGIGTPFRPQGGNQEAVVHFMLLAPPYTQGVFSSGTVTSTIPADLAFNADQTKVIVRSFSTGNFDIMIFPVDLTAALLASFSANGFLSGVDSVAAGANGAVSISTINPGSPGRVQFFAP